MTETIRATLPDGGYLHAQIAGPATAPCVVLVNSIMTNMHVWDSQFEALSERYRVVRYDQRGHGRSGPPGELMTLDQYGADLLALLDICHIGRFAFVGLSMGVPIGLAAFSATPGRFDGFVAVDGVARSAPGREAFWSERRTFARQNGMAALAADTATRWLAGALADVSQCQRLTEMIAATSVEGFAAATHALQCYDYSAVLPTLDCPFLGIAGAQDGAMPEAMRAQFSGIPGTQFALIERAGHVPNFQQPKAFNAALSEFLAETTRGPTRRHIAPDVPPLSKDAI